MRIVESNKAENYIIVNVEDDDDTTYLWKWGSYGAIRNSRGDYIIRPTNNNRMNFQTCLENLVRITNE